VSPLTPPVVGVDPVVGAPVVSPPVFGPVIVADVGDPVGPAENPPSLSLPPLLQPATAHNTRAQAPPQIPPVGLNMHRCYQASPRARHVHIRMDRRPWPRAPAPARRGRGRAPPRGSAKHARPPSRRAVGEAAGAVNEPICTSYR